MKNFVKASVFITCLLASLCVFADPIPTEGSWGTKGLRTLTPAPPSASIEGDTLSIYMADPLSNLTVKVTDSDGNIVYQECISSYDNNFTYSVQLEVLSGEYHLTMIHYYGTLCGTFEIE